MKSHALEPVRLYCIAVALVGAGVLAALVATSGVDLEGRRTLEFLALAGSVMIGELFPIEAPRRSGDGEITVSVMFSFALLLGVGLVPALAAQLVASVVQDGIARKPWWQLGFNIGQYTLSLAAAAGVLALLGGYPEFGTGHFQAVDLLMVVGGAAGYFVVNLLLVTRATTLYIGAPFSHALRSDLMFGLSVIAVLLCLAPVVVTVLQFSPILYPLLLVPLIGVYISGRQTVRTATAEHLARHDSLTELPNRRWFLESVGVALKNPSLQAGGLLLVDLNGFKEINDTLGHHHGDLVLQEVGPRLRAAFRSEDLVARLGGDEFAVFMPGADIDAAQAAVGRLQDALHTPVDVDGIEIELDASIGLAWYPDHGGDVDTLLQRADVAMYRAKATHHPLVTYRAEDDSHSPERLVIAADLRRALAADQLVLHYQPQVELGHGRPVAAEGLVRWHHPQRGLLGPPEFIEVAERTGLIKDLTYRVLDLGLSDLRDWADDGRKLSLSLNVSVRSLLDRRFPEEVEKLLSRHGVDGTALTLELTESSLMVDPEVAKKTMRHLAELGVSVAIDDFGTGYSSLAYLTDLPIGELKIDKSFVRAMGSDARNAIVVRSTIELAHNLGLRTVAEGIEDSFTFERLRALGCELAQGFHMSKPLSAAKLVTWWDVHAAPANGAATAPARAVRPRTRLSLA
ncbi:MAG TPA: bifunctional diguanylate cyclase/phosphodiesterase [Solirubrobacteraceae bacterium]|jgi:diguanylate cyclase (GGDEF)-like protein|nr:bifunctional diguanylate cyclase/phosphodiesterase [Solirubrobacteraceae bacterium]